MDLSRTNLLFGGYFVLMYLLDTVLIIGHFHAFIRFHRIHHVLLMVVDCRQVIHNIDFQSIQSITLVSTVVPFVQVPSRYVSLNTRLLSVDNRDIRKRRNNAKQILVIEAAIHWVASHPCTVFYVFCM